MARPEEDPEVLWLLDVLGCKRPFLYDVVEMEFRYLLQPRRKQVLPTMHPDKQRNAEDRQQAEAHTKRFNDAWDKLESRVPRGWLQSSSEGSRGGAQRALNAAPEWWEDAWRPKNWKRANWDENWESKPESGKTFPRSSNDVSGASEEHEASGSGRRTEEEPSGHESGPCADAPHCNGFESQHGKINAVKALEYKFLYAAHSKCVRCMEYYASQPGLDLNSKSCGMNARKWAGTAVGTAKRTEVVIPDDVEQWLQEHNL